MKIKESVLEFARRTPLLKKVVKPLPPPNRRIFIGNRQWEAASDSEFQINQFPDNVVITSKYTLWSFLPVNLFGQLKRIANFYFVCVSIILLIVPTSIGPTTTLVPLIFVLIVTAVKQGYEDWLRHKADRSVNDYPVTVLRSGQLTTTKSKHIVVGDIVKVESDGVFPCDLVLLSSSDSEGECSVQTTNLDGETNLKVFRCVAGTQGLNSEEELDSLKGRIECEQSTPDLYSFLGRIYIQSVRGRVVANGEAVVRQNSAQLAKSLGPENVLLRGAKLKSTEFVYGCAIYTGQDTKMALNSKQKSTKRSRVEKKMNTLLLIFLMILLVESAICVSLEYWWTDTYWLVASEKWLPWYIYASEDVLKKTATNVVDNFLAFVVLFNYLIPISLYVTIEMQKFLGSIFFGWDLGMYDPQTDQAAKANTSDLNEELGQVEYLFCDKTGTLTENDMQFRCCCVGSILYEDTKGSLNLKDGTDIVDARLEPSKELDAFLTALAVCHTARVESQVAITDDEASYSSAPGSIDRASGSSGHDSVDRMSKSSGHDSIDGASYVYHASSPDEKALVEACRRYGVVYHGTQSGGRIRITSRKSGQSVIYHLQHVLEFDSDRKCMSVIVKDSNGDFWLICKGAESSVLKNCDRGATAAILQAVDNYARLGYRTLVVARRQLSADEFRKCDQLLNTAKNSLGNRALELSEAYRSLEQNLEALGATAVEDRLQDDVADTVTALREAGIKVWVLTGDKEETAVNISYSAGLFDQKMELLRVVRQQTSNDTVMALAAASNTMVARGVDARFGLVMDGQSLAFVLGASSGTAGSSGDTNVILRNLCHRASAILCCRMSPIQKAQIVRLVKKDPAAPVTAAIGDGANDVSMIQAAHVGLGIMGKEGRHAARCSDYAFVRFKFLRRALFVHGHLYYLRLANLIQYSFYKNVAFCTMQVSYSYFNAFSAQTFFDSYFLLFYNLAFTALPVLLYGLFEQHLPPEILETNARLYKKNRNNILLSPAHFIKWLMLGLWHSIVLFFVPYLLYAYSNTNISAAELGSITYTICIFVANSKLVISSYFWSWVAFFGFAFTFIIYLSMSFFYSNMLWPSFMVTGYDEYGIFNDMFSSAAFYLLCALCFVLALLPDLFLRFYRDLSSSTFRRLVHQSSPAEVCYNAHGDKLTISFTGSSGKLTLSQTNIMEHMEEETL